MTDSGSSVQGRLAYTMLESTDFDLFEVRAIHRERLGGPPTRRFAREGPVSSAVRSFAVIEADRIGLETRDVGLDVETLVRPVGAGLLSPDATSLDQAIRSFELKAEAAGRLEAQEWRRHAFWWLSVRVVRLALIVVALVVMVLPAWFLSSDVTGSIVTGVTAVAANVTLMRLIRPVVLGERHRRLATQYEDLAEYAGYLADRTDVTKRNDIWSDFTVLQERFAAVSTEAAAASRQARHKRHQEAS